MRDSQARIDATYPSTAVTDTHTCPRSMWRFSEMHDVVEKTAGAGSQWNLRLGSML